ncbi:16027_t:CDS:2 [Acaulospora morrowiae]|uniref:16027_t:CDS:1 n=1 Tax=Acaulospora morrowiae TaxID=94023 RepID=A0A9N9I971_9GLOM|nr:16027_t:CDS:2 [Acaulospora morrowiae]
MSASPLCIFCKIIKKEIPSYRIFETEHTRYIMKLLSIILDHSKFLHELPDESLADLLPVAKKVANAIGAENYNILQNNGALAHQQVEHVHIHVIPKPNSEEGLGVGWPAKSTSKEDLAATAEKILQGFKD